VFGAEEVMLMIARANPRMRTGPAGGQNRSLQIGNAPSWPYTVRHDRLNRFNRDP